MTEVLFVEVLRSWIKSLRPGEGGWLGRWPTRHIVPALRLIHEIQINPDASRPWAPRRPSSLGFFGALHQTRWPAHAPISDRATDGGGCVSARSHRRWDCTDFEPGGLRHSAAFSKLFKRHHGLSPGRYRAARRTNGGQNLAPAHLEWRRTFRYPDHVGRKSRIFWGVFWH